MRLSFGLEQRQVQKQILAPRMIQSMEILQLPIMALEERIQQELQENPVLEIREEDPDLPVEEVESPPPDAPTDEERELVIDDSTGNERDFERLLNMDEEYPEYFEEHSPPSRNRVEEESERKHDQMANVQARDRSLQDYLHDQLSWFDLSPAVRAMADRIIYNLDPNGYLQTSLEDLVGPTGTEADLAVAREALGWVQRLDPPGVGARDLRECLLLQLREGMPYYAELKTLISNHLEDIEHNRLPAIARKTGYSIPRIQEAIKQLRTLNPKPGATFHNAPVPPVIPDVFVEQGEDGRYVVRLEDGHVPSLFISPTYRKLLQSGEASPEAREFIKQKLNSAQWLIEAIQQRRNTLLRVSQAIVDHQSEFLDKGPESIRPLKMQQIADKVGVHVTTVSRAVDDKWIQTPRGIFPLRRFFVGGKAQEETGEVAWDTVRLKLKELIDKEDKQRPLRDDELVEELRKQGIEVARRTVTKYRQAMGIPSSRERRDWSAAKF